MDVELTPGQAILGKYKIVRLIGEGGMARVWLASELTFGGREVALKTIRTDLSPLEREEVQRRHHREVQVHAALQQVAAPHVAPVHTVETLDGEPILVMAYMAGGSLATRLAAQGQELTVDETLAITRAILAALHAAHTHPWEIVHRDLKPDNILFDGRGQPYLADFGLAQLATMSGRTRLVGDVHPGSPLYMAPEQASSTGYLTPAADIYALGCLLFEMLTGKRYKRMRPDSQLSQFRDDAPAWLEAVLARALAEDAWDRYADAGEMLAALEEQPAAVQIGQTDTQANAASDTHLAQLLADLENARQAQDWRKLVEAGRAILLTKNLPEDTRDQARSTLSNGYYRWYDYTYQFSAHTYEPLQNYRAVMAELSKAIASAPDQPDYYWLRGLLRIQRNMYTQCATFSELIWWATSGRIEEGTASIHTKEATSWTETTSSSWCTVWCANTTK